MSQRPILFLSGDGIGPEVMGEVERVVAWLDARAPVRTPRPTSLAGLRDEAHGVPLTPLRPSSGRRRSTP